MTLGCAATLDSEMCIQNTQASMYVCTQQYIRITNVHSPNDIFQSKIYFDFTH
jgi:hypothetical protein